MAFRNPTYLDTELLSNLADYFGVDLPDETSVTRRSVEEGSKGAGVNKIVTAKAESSRAQELTEIYSVTTRPVRLMNDLIDEVESSSALTDLDGEPEAAVARNALVQISGEMALSPVNEIGSIMARVLPMLVAQFSEGATDFNPSNAEIAEVLTAEPEADHRSSSSWRPSWLSRVAVAW